ncbi:MAG: molybdenum cofactor guanylyltransferase MobA [Thiogranum sp.]|nr:molybdenum cofactor guanylyltransferase MobA [Thiogranum sp.]
MISHNPIDDESVTLLILAGGRGSRMGDRDKGLILVSGKPIIELLLDRLQTREGRIIISANRNQEHYARYGHQVIADTMSGFPGPLAGMLAGLDACDTPLLLTVPVDAPLVNRDFQERMMISMQEHRVSACVAECAGQVEPMFCLLNRNLKHSLQEFLNLGGRSAREWLEQTHAHHVDFSDMPDQFINLNFPDDLHKLAR